MVLGGMGEQEDISAPMGEVSQQQMRQSFLCWKSV